jgi:hypothetical protein
MSRFQRRHSFRDPKKFFIIATEGECTEQIYFDAVKPPRESAIQLRVLPTRKGRSHPKMVLARLQGYEREAGAGPTDELWLVVDRDSWTEVDLNAVADMVEARSNYRLALSNPCFELWLLLHLADAPPGVTKNRLADLLRDKWGRYEKNNYDATALLDHVDEAIRRAERLDNPPQEPWPAIQGTHVYRLMKALGYRGLSRG